MPDSGDQSKSRETGAVIEQKSDTGETPGCGSKALTWGEFKELADAFREEMIRSVRTFSDSTDLVREDRDRLSKPLSTAA